MSSHHSRLSVIIRTHLREQRGRLAIALLCTLGVVLAEIAAPWPLKLIFDHVLLGQPLPASLSGASQLVQTNKPLAVLALSLAMLFIAALRGLFAYTQLHVTSRVGYLLVHRLRRELFAHAQRLSLTFHNNARAGDLLTKITSDTTSLKDVFADTVIQFATQVLTIAGMAAVMLSLNVPLSLVAFATFPILWYALFVVYRRIKASAREQRQREGLVASRISEVLRAVPLVRSFARERYEDERLEFELSQTLRESIRMSRLEAAASRTTELIGAITLWLAVLVGALEVLRGHLTPGSVLVFTAYLTAMFKPMRQLARLSSQVSRAMVSAERIDEILETQREEDGDQPKGIARTLGGAVTFEHVRFDYGDGRPVLRDVSFSVQPGERVAIVGNSGAGKSTIVSLLLRFYEPRAGRIVLDGIDLSEYQRESLRQQMGVVLQDNVLFGASIFDNIAYGDPDAAFEDVVAAAAQAQAHEFISSLPEGYQTVVGERGCTLSGGQRQRICLARVILKRPALWILDEPTSAVDAGAAAIIHRAICNLQRARTLLLISHHFAGLEHFDRILVLRSGSLVEQGTHAELVGRRGYYHDLWRLQTGPGHGGDESKPAAGGAR